MIKKINLYYKIIFTSITLIILLSSCYKITHNSILKGKFHLNAFEINGGSTNFMGGVLPNYVDANGNVIGDYVIYMLDNGLMRGEYYSNGNLIYYRTGVWDMPTKDSVYMKIDVFVDGTFYMEQISTKEMLMSTNKNKISFFNIGEVSTTLRISNGKKMDPNSTKP